MLHRTHVTDPLTGAQFNDYETLNPKLLGIETEDVKFDYTTQVCAHHAKQYKMADGLDKGIGAGKCGVVGCDRAAVHNYSFMIPGFPQVVEPNYTPATPKAAPRKVILSRKAPTSLKGMR